MTRTPRLRGHHLICLQFFHGKGYSPEFVVNLMHILTDLEGSSLKVVAGKDDVCGPCPCECVDSSCIHDHGEGEDIDALDAYARELLDVEVGDVIEYARLREKVPQVLAQWRARACSGCEWETGCRSSLDILERLPTPPSAQ